MSQLALNVCKIRNGGEFNEMEKVCDQNEDDKTK